MEKIIPDVESLLIYIKGEEVDQYNEGSYRENVKIALLDKFDGEQYENIERCYLENDYLYETFNDEGPKIDNIDRDFRTRFCKIAISEEFHDEIPNVQQKVGKYGVEKLRKLYMKIMKERS